MRYNFKYFPRCVRPFLEKCIRTTSYILTKLSALRAHFSQRIHKRSGIYIGTCSALRALEGDVEIFQTKFIGTILMKRSIFKEQIYVRTDLFNDIYGGRS